MTVRPLPLTEKQAREAWGLLHHHAGNGYERGDCHCDACSIIVDDLVDFFEITPPKGSIYSPAAAVREAAQGRGW